MYTIKMKLLKQKIKRLDKKIARQKKRIIRRLKRSYMDVKNAIIHNLYTDDIHVRDNMMHTVSQETGECIDYLVYFPDSSIIHKIKDYLEAYLITNRDVLEEDKIGELEGLLRYFD